MMTRIFSKIVSIGFIILLNTVLNSPLCHAQSALYLTQPFGGEYYKSSENADINWQTNQMGLATISFTSDGGSTWEVVDSLIDLSSENLNWQVPNIPSTRCQIKISQNTAPKEEAISSNFAIGYDSILKPILIDELFGDWTPYAELLEPIPANYIAGFKAFNNNDFLYVYLKRNQTFSFLNQDINILYIDADDDPNTGLSVNGIGAEIEFFPGARNGYFYSNGEATEIGFSQLFMVSAPTVISNQFEFSVKRSAMINGINVFDGERIRILFKDKSSGSFFPEQSGGAKYRFKDYNFESVFNYSIKKQAEKNLRIMSHNVLFDGLYDPDKLAYFSRIYQSIRPDIIGFQEIYEHSAEDMVLHLENILPSQPGKSWKASNVNDTWVATSYTIKNTFNPGAKGNGAFLLDLRPDYQCDLLLISAHPPCCDNDANRQLEVDAIAAFIRDAKTQGGVFTLVENTPIVILGDMNFVGDTAQLRTLLHGDIVNENQYGEDFIPDWNETSFVDSKPTVTGLPMVFTQGNSNSPGSYAKGRLDFMIYSSSVLELENRYLHYTHSMPADTLLEHNLLMGDSESASDHFPVVADFIVYDTLVENTGITPLRHNNALGEPRLKGQEYTVSGVLTALGQMNADHPAFIQDQHAGIAFYANATLDQLNVGDSISVHGMVECSNGLTILAVDINSTDIEVHESDIEKMPKIKTLSQINHQAWNAYEMIEGTLVRVDGVQFVEEGVFEANTIYNISSADDTLHLWVSSASDIMGNAIPEGVVSVVGIIAQCDTTIPYESGYRIMPNSINDIFSPQSSVEITQPAVGELLYAGANYSIQWNHELIDKVNLFYKTLSDNEWVSIVENFNANVGVKTWQVPGIEDSVQIKIEDATDETIFDVSETVFIKKDYSILPLRVNNMLGEPVLLDEVRTISGIVTSSNNFGSNGPGFIQDEHIGIAFYGNQYITALQEGDSATISGKVYCYYGLTELKFNESNIEVHKNTTVPTPEKVTIADVLTQSWSGVEALEGKLIQINDVEFIENGAFAAYKNYSFSDGIESMVLRTYGETDLPGKAIPDSATSIIGCLSQYKSSAPYSSGYQLLVRKYSDIGNFNTKIEESRGEIGCTLFPNPAKKVVTFYCNNLNAQTIRMQITNLYGQILRSKSIDNSMEYAIKHSFCIEDFKSGIYLCKIKMGNEISVLKFVKE